MNSQALQIAYASAPTEELILSTLELEGYGLRLVQNYEDMQLGGFDYEATSMSIALPEKATGGRQTMRVSFAIVDDRAQNIVDSVRESGETVFLVLKQWLLSDPTAPSATPIRMQVLGGVFDDVQGVMQVECAFFDMLNAKWPREIYTAQKAPGMKWQ